MTDNRLNHLMILHVHKNKTDNLDLVSIGNIFIGASNERKEKFGKFRAIDIQIKSNQKYASTQTDL